MMQRRTVRSPPGFCCLSLAQSSSKVSMYFQAET